MIFIKKTNYNSFHLLRSYEKLGRTITVFLKGNHSLIGTIKWYDSFAINLRLKEEKGTVTILLHNIIYYESDHIKSKKDLNFHHRVYRNIPIPTHKEKEELFQYINNQELLHFYLESGFDVKGRIRWCTEPVYCIREENGDYDYMIIKRHILYYKKIKPDIDE